MPSQEKALNPFVKLGLSESLLITLGSVMIVLIMLAIVWLVIRLVRSAAANNSSNEEVAPRQAVSVPAATPAPAAAVMNEGEVVAVMMAAVAEETGMSPNDFRITNVSAAPAAAPVAAPAAAPVAAPAAPASVPAAPAAVAAGETAVNSPMPGSVFKVECAVGQSVNAGDVLVVLEAMKMEIEISAPAAGTVKSVPAVVGSTVNTDDLLVTLG